MAEQHRSRTPTIAPAATDASAAAVAGGTIQPAAMLLLQSGKHKCQPKQADELAPNFFTDLTKSFAARTRTGSATLAVKLNEKSTSVD